MKLQKIVAINLKYLRYKSNMSQEEFYTKAKLNAKYMAAVERGSINFRANSLDKIAKNLNVDLKELLLIDERRIISQKRIDQKMSK